MKISKKQFLDNIVGFEVLKGNKYALYYDPFKNKKKGGAVRIKDTIRGRSAPYIISFIGGVTLKLLYDASMLLNKAINEKDKTKTNYKIFKEYIKEEYGTASNAFRNLIVIPGIAGAIGGLSYDKIEEKYKDDKLVWPYINGARRIIAGEKKPGRKPNPKPGPEPGPEPGSQWPFISNAYKYLFGQQKQGSKATVEAPLPTLPTLPTIGPLKATSPKATSPKATSPTATSPLDEAYYYDYSEDSQPESPLRPITREVSPQQQPKTVKTGRPGRPRLSSLTKAERALKEAEEKFKTAQTKANLDSVIANYQFARKRDKEKAEKSEEKALRLQDLYFTALATFNKLKNRKK